MPPDRTARGPCCLRPHDINARIRRLMDRPADKHRTAEYERLLILWAEADHQDDMGRAA